MRRFIVLSVLCFVLAPFSAASAKGNGNDLGDFRLALIDDPLRTVFLGDPAKLQQQQIQQAISVAALAKDWQVLKEYDGRTELSITVRGKHLLHVMLNYDRTGYDIQYLDSANLLYKESSEGGRRLRVIHKNYNLWIRELVAAINSKVGEPAKITVATGAVGVRPAPLPKAAPPKLTHAHPVPPDSGFAAIDNLDALPLRAAGKDRYQYYLSLPSPKAFIVTEKGGWRLWYKSADVMAKALDYCEQETVGCWLYAVDDRVLWDADPSKRFSKFEQLLKIRPQ